MLSKKRLAMTKRKKKNKNLTPVHSPIHRPVYII